jgi:tRNA pseudouridine synthase 9
LFPGKPITGRSKSISLDIKLQGLKLTDDFVFSAHQIRVHLQYIGHPIVNDPLYGTSDIWGPNLGKGGVDLTPDITDENAETTGGSDTPSTIASVEARMQGKESLPSAKLQQKFNWKLEKELMKLRANGGKQSPAVVNADSGTGTPQKDLLPREMEDDTVVGGSPIYLSREAREIVAKLRRQKDEQEDWAK